MKDAANNTATCSTTFTVTDNTPPVIVSCAPALSAFANASCQAAIPNFKANVTATDNCTAAASLTITQSPAVGTLVSTGVTTVTLTVKDAANNTSTCSTTFTVTDNTPPVIVSCAPAQSASANASCQAAVPNFAANVTATDNCTAAASLTITQSPAVGTLVSTGVTTVTITVKDAANNTATCSTTFTVTDNTPPVLSGQGASTTINCPATPVFTAPVAYDACDETPIISFTDNSVPGTCSGTYTTTRTWVATDVSGNTSLSVSQAITVQDITPPVITCPASIVVQTDPGLNTATVTVGQPIVSDNCGTVTFTNNFNNTNNASGIYNLGINYVTWTAIDECGNTSICNMTVTVNDNEGPTMNCPETISVSCAAEVPASYNSLAEFISAGGFAEDNNGLNASSFTMLSQTSDNLSCPETISRVYSIADNDGNTSTCIQQIIVNDLIVPVFEPLPASTTINCPLTPSFTNAVVTDNCGSTTLTFNDVTINGACAGSYSVTRTWTATDNCGNISTASQTINVQDVSAPVIDALPAPYTIVCPAVPEFEVPTATDACGSTITFTSVDVTTPGACSGLYSVTRTWTASDACGNSSTASQTIHVQDLSAPIIDPLPAVSNVYCPYTPLFAVATATDACGSIYILTYNDVTTPGDCAGSYSVTRTWTATDACGNSSTASQTINVLDISAPVIAPLPAPVTINCPAVPVFEVATATDECASAFTLTSNDVTSPGDCAGSYSVTRTWTATDACGNSSTASQTILVQDVTAPVITPLPAPTTINCPAVPVFEVATAIDACASAFNLTSNDVTTPGDCAGSYSVTRTWTATDACGNSSTASQTINVLDISAPVIAPLPAPYTINCPAVPVFEVATATDACGSAFTLTSNDVTTPGDCAGSYSVTRTWTATDACGNSSTASQIINVQDVTAPVIAPLPAPSTINCPALPVFEVATAIDLCGSTFTLTSNDITIPGDCAGSYSVTRTWTATDNCGNSSTASQTINVQDVSAPVIDVLPAPYTIVCPAVPEFEVPTATDACGSTITFTSVDVTTPGACSGLYSVTRTWTASDACGNSSTASQTIHVQDLSAPIIDPLPAVSDVYCPYTPLFAVATATDACGSVFILTYNDVTTPGACAGSYSVTRTWTATDACGNSSTASQTINVLDISAPVIAPLPAPVTINCPAVPVFEVATATDECGSAFTLTPNDVTSPGDCAGSYSVTRTWTATDACGNSSTASQTINVQDITAPELVCPPQFEVTTNVLNTYVGAIGIASATDNCDASVSITNNAPAVFPLGTTIVTWTATDECGNISTCQQNVIVSSTPIIANDDTGASVNGYDGGTSVTNVLANDELNGNPVNPAEVNLTELSSTHPGISLNGAAVVVAPGTPAGTYTLTYQICEILNPLNCDQATVSVTVGSASIVANDDTGASVNGYDGGTSVTNVLANDELNGNPVNPAEVNLTELSSTNPGISLNGAAVVVAPGTPAGTYTLTYQICEILNPLNCDQATVSVTVGSASIVANDDTGASVNGYNGGTSVTNVLANDELNGNPVNPAEVNLTELSSTHPGISLNGAAVVVAPGTPAGTYTLTYQICEILNPLNCDQATVSVTVGSASIVANDDTGASVNGYDGGTSVTNVLANDELNGNPVNPAEVNLTELSSTNPGISLNGAAVVVAPGTPAGTYTLTYQICEILNPLNCDQATVSVTVGSASIVANDDTGTSVNGYDGGHQRYQRTG